MLIGGFIYDHPIAAIGLLFLLIGLFKLMNQFEAARRSGDKKPPDR